MTEFFGRRQANPTHARIAPLTPLEILAGVPRPWGRVVHGRRRAAAPRRRTGPHGLSLQKSRSAHPASDVSTPLKTLLVGEAPKSIFDFRASRERAKRHPTVPSGSISTRLSQNFGLRRQLKIFEPRGATASLYFFSGRGRGKYKLRLRRIRCTDKHQLFVSVHVNFPTGAGAGTDDAGGLRVLKAPEALALVRRCPDSIALFGCNARVWQVEREIRRTEAGELVAERFLAKYDSTDIPEQFLVVRT
ncbi:hypothetical protein DFH06DRAFT_1329985 [Mycena polygramma]|nr:hypothetical protein DFH06DRAFT_1329985 [Mycena polygramma]